MPGSLNQVNLHNSSWAWLIWQPLLQIYPITSGSVKNKGAIGFAWFWWEAMSGLTPLPPVSLGGGALPPVHHGPGGGCGGSMAMVPAGHPPHQQPMAMVPAGHPPHQQPQQAAASAGSGAIPWPSMPMLSPYDMMPPFDAGPAPRATRGKGAPSSSGGRRREAQQIYAMYWGQMKDRGAPV